MEVGCQASHVTISCEFARLGNFDRAREMRGPLYGFMANDKIPSTRFPHDPARRGFEIKITEFLILKFNHETCFENLMHYRML